MKIIATDYELSQASLSPELRVLLVQRRAMLNEYDLPLEAMAKFIVVEAQDGLADLKRVLGPWSEIPWEWVQDHGFAYEAPIVCSDDGFALVLIVAKECIDPLLHQLLLNGIEEGQ